VGAGTTEVNVNLGYEPQWLLIKNATGTSDWTQIDTMRGMTVNNGVNRIRPNQSFGEAVTSDALAKPTATGFTVGGTSDFNWLTESGKTFIYIAIRRGPMKVPTTGTSVYHPFARAGNDTQTDITGVGFTPDLWMVKSRNITADFPFFDRLRGVTRRVASNSTFQEESFSGSNGLVSLNMNGITIGAGATDGGICNDTGINYGNWLLKRAPGFFDEVCWTGVGGVSSLTHNLTVSPELIIVKSRADSAEWFVWHSSFTNSQYMFLNRTDASYTGGDYFGSSAPVATSTIFKVGPNSDTNGTKNFVAYLFATCPGVSKVGTYSGNGSTQAIACGFTGGARFVLIKRTNTSGEWYVYDTARGMTTLTSPNLRLNSTAAESATLGSVTTTTGGFTVDATVLSAVNNSGSSYIFMAIA
jgi:hypothetical protein